MSSKTMRKIYRITNSILLIPCQWSHFHHFFFFFFHLVLGRVIQYFSHSSDSFTSSTSFISMYYTLTPSTPFPAQIAHSHTSLLKMVLSQPHDGMVPSLSFNPASENWPGSAKVSRLSVWANSKITYQPTVQTDPYFNYSTPPPLLTSFSRSKPPDGVSRSTIMPQVTQTCTVAGDFECTSVQLSSLLGHGAWECSDFWILQGKKLISLLQ